MRIEQVAPGRIHRDIYDLIRIDASLSFHFHRDGLAILQDGVDKGRTAEMLDELHPGLAQRGLALTEADMFGPHA